jgi:hypothetical protein
MYPLYHIISAVLVHAISAVPVHAISAVLVNNKTHFRLYSHTITVPSHSQANQANIRSHSYSTDKTKIFWCITTELDRPARPNILALAVVADN